MLILLFNEAEDCQDHKAEEPTEETFTVKAHARKKKRTIDELAKNLPIEEIVIDLPESRMWLYASGEYSKQHIRIFTSPTGVVSALKASLRALPDV